MIDPERMIGGLIGSALSGGFRGKKRKRKSGSLVPGGGAAIGMGLMGLAFAAFDHFQQSQAKTSSPSSVPPPSGREPTRSPLAPSEGSSSPPPPPGTIPATGAVPPPPPGGAVSPAAETADREQEALLILQAMIAAANADYSIDEDEKQRILERAKEGGLNQEEMNLISEELEHPRGLTEIVQRVKTPMQAEEVYVASLLAIEVDTPAEKGYLRSLKERLQLDPQVALRWERQFEAEV